MKGTDDPHLRTFDLEEPSCPLFECKHSFFLLSEKKHNREKRKKEKKKKIYMATRPELGERGGTVH